MSEIRNDDLNDLNVKFVKAFEKWESFHRKVESGEISDNDSRWLDKASLRDLKIVVGSMKKFVDKMELVKE